MNNLDRKPDAFRKTSESRMKIALDKQRLMNNKNIESERGTLHELKMQKVFKKARQDVWDIKKFLCLSISKNLFQLLQSADSSEHTGVG